MIFDRPLVLVYLLLGYSQCHEDITQGCFIRTLKASQRQKSQYPEKKDGTLVEKDSEKVKSLPQSSPRTMRNLNHHPQFIAGFFFSF